MGQGISFKERVKVAAKELSCGNYSNVAPAFINPSHYRDSIGSGFMMAVNGQYNSIDYCDPNRYLLAYRRCSPLNSIINKKAQSFTNGNTWLLNTTGKAKGKEATGDPANKLRVLLNKPNQLQSWEQFEAQAYIYEQINEYNIIFIIKPAGFENIDATSIWNIPPSMIDILESNTSLFRDRKNTGIQSIYLNYKGERIQLLQDDVFIIKGNMPSAETFILPESRIRSLSDQINNIIKAYNVRGSIIEDRGALGIISSDKTDDSGNVSMTPKEKEALQQDFSRYGLTRGQWKYIITNAALKWQSIGYSTKELMLFEEIEDDIMRICDSFGYPHQLMSSSNGTTFSNLNDAKKLLYQDTIIPESKSFYRQLNEMFNTSQYGFIIDKDFSHVAALQEDDLKKAQARLNRNKALEIEFRYNIITINRWLELNGEDTRSDGDLYFSDVKELVGNPTMSSAGNNQAQDNQVTTTQ